MRLRGPSEHPAALVSSTATAEVSARAADPAAAPAAPDDSLHSAVPSPTLARPTTLGALIRQRSTLGLLQSLAKPVAAAVTGALLVATPALGADPQHWSLTSAYIGDTNTQKGQTDAFGDLKDLRLAARKDGVVVATEAAMITPQRGVDRAQRDTGLMSLTVGKETERAGAYVTFGQLNGTASELMYQAIDASHASGGMGPSRKSPASADPGLYGALSGRVDFDAKLVDVGRSELRLETTGHGTLGTIKQGVGGQVLLALESPGAGFRPNVPGLPAPAVRGHVVYIGLAGEVVGKDVVTDALGTRPFRASAVAGVAVSVGEHVSVGAEYRQALLPEVKGADAKPISTFGFTVNVSF